MISARIGPVVPETPPPVQRRVSSRGVNMVAGQRIGLGIGQTVTVTSDGDRLQVRNDERLLVEVARTTTKPIARFKARKPEPHRRPSHIYGSAENR